MTIINTVVLGFVCFLLATVAFDGLHYLLHRCSDSRQGWLRQLGELHQTHHRFLDCSLHIDRGQITGNLCYHVVPEYLTQLLVTSLFLLIFPHSAVYFAWGLETLVFVLILRLRGFDVNHREVDRLTAYRPHLFCLPEYHALHHVYPDAYFSSWIKVLDHLLKTGLSLKQRKLALIGPDTGTMQSLQALLRERGVELLGQVPFPDSRSPLDVERLAAVDVLLVCEPAPGPGRLAAYHQLVDDFSRAPRNSQAPKELWVLSTLAHAGTDSRQAWQQVSRYWFYSQQLIYRHLVVDTQPASDRQIRWLVSGICRGYNLQVLSWRLAAWREALAVWLPLGRPLASNSPFIQKPSDTHDKTHTV